MIFFYKIDICEKRTRVYLIEHILHVCNLYFNDKQVIRKTSFSLGVWTVNECMQESVLILDIVQRTDLRLLVNGLKPLVSEMVERSVRNECMIGIILLNCKHRCPTSPLSW